MSADTHRSFAQAHAHNKSKARELMNYGSRGLFFSFGHTCKQTHRHTNFTPAFASFTISLRTHTHTPDGLCLVLVGHSPSAGQMINANAC